MNDIKRLKAKRKQKYKDISELNKKIKQAKTK